MGVRFVIRSAEGKAVTEEIAYGFDQARIAIGRGLGADIRIPHLTVSELHATVRFDTDAYSILDNDSTNGTLVNGTRLFPGRAKRLNDGDRIDIGAYTLSFHAGVALSHPTTIEHTAELARRLFRQSPGGLKIDAPRVCVLSGPETGKSLDIPSPPARLVIGREASCQLVLPDPDVSREHAELRRDLDGVSIRNLGSKNGLNVNGQLLEQRRLRDGDELVLGTTRLLFEEPADEPIDNLSGESDLALPPRSEAPTARPGPEEAPHGADLALTAEPEPRPSGSRSRPAHATSLGADFVIYALAAVVIALSVAGLIVLIRGN